MPIFTVHVPRETLEPRVLAERIRFVPDGFAWGAFFCGPLWLIGNRLWLALMLWIVAAALVELLAALGFGLLTLIGLGLLIQYFLGLEGNGFLAAALRRRGLVLSDVVAAPDRDAAERAYFQRRAQARSAVAADAATDRRPAGGDRDEFVGLSPDPGG